MIGSGSVVFSLSSSGRQWADIADARSQKFLQAIPLILQNNAQILASLLGLVMNL